MMNNLHPVHLVNPVKTFSGPGDSGGPVFIDGAIAGVTSIGSGLPSADYTDAVDASWGEMAFDMRVSAFHTFLDEATGGTAAFVLDALPGDYIGNGTVEQTDLDLVLLHWGAAVTPVRWTHDPPTGAIDQGELDAVLLNWGNTAPTAATASAAVPEPNGALLVALLAVGALAIGYGVAPRGRDYFFAAGKALP